MLCMTVYALHRQLFIACLLAGLLAPNLSGQSPDREELRVDVGDAVLNLTAWGQGESVILISGGGGSAGDYEAIGPAFAAKGFRVFAVNARGVRGSSGSLEGLTLHDYARDVARLIDQVAAGQAHVFGPRMGSRIARCVAADFPERVATVTVVAAPGKVAGDPEAQAAAQLYFNDAAITRDELRELAQLALFAPGSDPSTFLAAREDWAEARAAVARANLVTPVDDWWLGGEAPMLVIQGESDRLAPVANGRLLKEVAPGRVTLVELEDTGHMADFERPTEVVEAAVEFWRQHPIRVSKP